ncbi:MAG: cysteine desulfurase [Fimbriimonadia bacterium]|jgi:cysteine desulfurase
MPGVRRIYLDHAATTPLDPVVREAMARALDGPYGNPSSQHWAGREAVRLLDDARDTIAQSLDAQAAEVCFTSGGTEAANLAVLGRAVQMRGGRVVVGATEHHCVLRAADLAGSLGGSVHVLAVDSQGLVNPDDVRDALAEPTAVVSVMHANNETGTLQPVADIARICAERETAFFCDAVQTWGVLPLPEADLLAVSAHKAYGPKGVGTLRIRPGTRVQPMLVGGGQERERRAGTENLLGIVGMAAAAMALPLNAAEHLTRVRDAFETEVLERMDGVQVSSAAVPRHPGICHLTIEGVSAESLLIRLDQVGLAASSGAACSSGAIEASHVLLAMGFSPQQAATGVRFSFGRTTTIEEAQLAAEKVTEAVRALRR